MKGLDSITKCLCALSLAICWGASGQVSDETARFEVASVKIRSQPEPGHTGNIPPIRNFTGLLTCMDVTLNAVVLRAYSLVDYSTLIAPEWMAKNRYDIVARAPAGAKAEQVPAMLRNLLAERFKMRLHWETRDTSGYALVVGKSGLKLTPAKTNPPEGRDSGAFMADFSTNPPRLRYKSMPMPLFARALTNLIGRPVVDQTGLGGYFDIELSTSTEFLPSLAAMAPASDPSAPSIFEAVKTLGLKLEPQRVPVRFLIVDSAQRIPTEN
jgi:uncharacterized protein (TIGR03435 family)